MLIRLAWKNIWRNRVRSLVVIGSVMAGLWAGLFLMAFSWGMYREHIQDAISTQFSHIQIHHPQYLEEVLPELTIPEGDRICGELESTAGIHAVSCRLLASGMISSPTGAFGVTIRGIDPANEFEVSELKNDITEGAAFPGINQHEVMLGERLAAKLHVELKKKVVLTFQTAGGEVTAGAFRICGIFKTRNSMFDESQVFIRKDGLADLSGSGTEVHEIAILLQDENTLEEVTEKLRDSYPGTEVMTWKELSPELRLIIDSFNEYMMIFIGIILIALMFGIINTMLMAVLERQREFGILMAIGMNRRKVFALVVAETCMLVSAGIPVGLSAAYLTIYWTGQTGIDISAFSEGLARYGFANIVYPSLELSNYMPVALLTLGCALLSSVYPAYRAVQYKPAEAIRRI